ncbi:CBS domain-containing protein [bacterium]|nr:CBS domain-containing protein [bacterium]
MKISELLKKKGNNVLTTDADLSLRNTIKIMIEARVGSVLVVNEQKQPIGIYTERDFLKQAIECKNLDEIKVGDVMTTDLIIVTPDEDIDRALSTMTGKRLRHLPVIENKELIGIISIGDIVKAKLKDSQFEAKHMRDYIMGKY